MGLITLIRPTNILILIVFILYDVTSLVSLKEKIKLLWFYKKQLFFIGLFAFVVWSPQFIYWKYISGNWVYYSFLKEQFYFDNPRIFYGLFSYRKGWLLYTPIMIFALLGIFFLFKFQKKWALPILIFTPLNIYVIYSWWCWWYGGSFGSRPMVDSYALMAIPLATFFSYFDKKTNYFRSVPLFIMFLTISLNLFQTQQSRSCLHYDSMTEDAYWSNFTTLGWSNNWESLLKSPDYERALNGEDEYNQ